MRRASPTSGGLLQPPSRGNNEGGWMRERAQVGIERNERETKMKVSKRRRKTDIFFFFGDRCKREERMDEDGFEIYIKAEMGRIGGMWKEKVWKMRKELFK